MSQLFNDICVSNRPVQELKAMLQTRHVLINKERNLPSVRVINSGKQTNKQNEARVEGRGGRQCLCAAADSSSTSGVGVASGRLTDLCGPGGRSC